MLVNKVILDKGNFGTVFKLIYENEECALKICTVEINEDSALNKF